MEQDIKKTTKRELMGTVIKAAMNKTITVNVESRKLHPKYKKSYKVNKKYHVHDEKSEAKPGNRVVFVECRPLSKTKRWRLIKILNQK